MIAERSGHLVHPARLLHGRGWARLSHPIPSLLRGRALISLRHSARHVGPNGDGGRPVTGAGTPGPAAVASRRRTAPSGSPSLLSLPSFRFRTPTPTMSFFRRKDKGPAIPLPPSEQPSYGQQSWQPQEKPAKHDEARAQLFAGAPSSSSSTNRSYSSGPPYDSGGGAAPDPYASRTSRNVLPPSSDPYAARGAAPRDRPQETDPSRAALFAGYNPAAIPREQGRRQYADQTSGGAAGDSAGGMHQTQEEEDEDVEMIKRDMRGVKQETLGSSR